MFLGGFGSLWVVLARCGRFWLVLYFITNDDSSQPNAKMAKVVKDECIYLYLYAIKDILPGTEIRYNYDAPKLWWRREVFARYAFNIIIQLIT